MMMEEFKLTDSDEINYLHMVWLASTLSVHRVSCDGRTHEQRVERAQGLAQKRKLGAAAQMEIEDIDE